MTTAVFNLMFDKLIGAEGGFQNDPKDRGNWTSGIIGKGECKGTKYGVSAMAYPDLDIENLTIEQAKKIIMTTGAKLRRTICPMLCQLWLATRLIIAVVVQL